MKMIEENSKKCKKVSKTLNYVEHVLILASTVTGCVCISTFTYLVGILVAIANSVWIIIRAMTVTLKKYKSIIKKKKKKHDQVEFLEKTKLNTAVLISEVLTN